MFNSKDLSASILSERGALLAPNCRVSATDPGKPPACMPRSARPRPQGKPNKPSPVTPDPEPGKLSAACGHDHEKEYDRGPRRAAGLDALRRELRARIGEGEAVL